MRNFLRYFKSGSGIAAAAVAVVLSYGQPGKGWDCTSKNLEVQIANEFLKFFELGGLGGLGSRQDAIHIRREDFKYIVPQIFPPQTWVPTYQLEDLERLMLIEVKPVAHPFTKGLRKAKFLISKGPERSKSYGLAKSTRGSKEFTFLFDLQAPKTQEHYGCAVLMGLPRKSGGPYIILPALSPSGAGIRMIPGEGARE